ncbi:ICMT-domain-containing protein, partial [Artomyces pyxidatus]
LEQRLRQREALQSRPLETVPTAAPAKPQHGNIPNTPLAASTISFLLGSTFTTGLFIFLSGGFSQFWWTTYQVGFFVAAWATFHWAEFAVTAGWNREKCSVDSFLLDNGAMYHVANSLALLEYLVTLYFKPSLKAYPYVSEVGIFLTLAGQVLRSTAMIQASTNFSHALAFRKRDSHELVTGGVYGWFRHPSYAGFFYWALGTQLTLQNPFTFVVFVALLWRFFSQRVKTEERVLVNFFGNAYVEYRSRVGTMIPFIP